MSNHRTSTTAPASIGELSANSLMGAIYRYRGEWSLYLARCIEAEERGEREDTVSHDYEASEKIIATWDRPAASRAEARLALEVAIADYEIGDTDRIPAMMRAALGWLAGEPEAGAN